MAVTPARDYDDCGLITVIFTLGDDNQGIAGGLAPNADLQNVKFKRSFQKSLFFALKYIDTLILLTIH